MIGQSNIYRTLFEKINDGILILSADGSILESNDAAENILGYSSEELGSIQLESAFVDPNQYQEIINLVQAGVPVVEFDVQLFTKENYKIHCAITTCLETDLSQNITGYLIVIKNITRQLRTEKALNERLRFETGVAASFRSLFEDSSASIDNALHHIMRAVDVGRVSVLRAVLSEDKVSHYSLTHEVDISDPIGTSSLQRGDFNFPTEFFVEDGFEKVAADLEQGDEAIVHISHLTGKARAIFESRDVKSMLLLPLQVAPDWFGVLLLSDLEKEREWEDYNIELMQTFSSILGTFFARKQTQQKLQEQQNFLRQVIDLNPEFVFVKDINGRYELVNQAFANRYNKSVDSIIGHTDEVLTTNIDKVESFKNSDLAILTSGESEKVHEEEVVFPDGTTRWLRTTKRPIFNEHGEATHLLGLSVDLTNQVEISQKLEQREQFLQTILDTLPGAIFWKDRHRNYLGSNKYFADIGGTTPEALIGKSDYDMPWKKEEADAFRSDDAEVMENGSAKIGIIEPILQADGTSAWLETNKIALKDESGEVYGVLGTFQDVTERVNVSQMLEQREQFLQTILDSIPGAIFWKDREGNYLGSNQFFADIAGSTPEAIVGKSDYDMPWKTEEADAFRRDDAEVMESGTMKIGIIEPQLQADGTNAWLETNKIALKDENGEVYGVLGTFQEVTEKIRLQQEVRSSLEKRSRQVVLTTQVAQEVADATDLNELYGKVVTQVKELFGYYHVQLLKYDPALDTVALIAGYGDAGQKMLAMNHALPMGVGLIGTAADTGQSVLRPHIARDPNWKANPLLPETKGEIAVPIMSKSNVLGVLDVQSNVAGALSEDDQILLEGLCGQIAIAIESTNLRQELESQLRELLQLQKRLSSDAWSQYTKSDLENQADGFEYDLLSLRPFDEPSLPYNEFANEQDQDRGMISQPVSLRGQTIGYMGIKGANTMPLDEEEEIFLEAIADEVAGALEAARLFEEVENSLVDQARLANELETVAQVSTAAATVLDSEYLLQSVVDLAKESFQLYHAHVYLITEKGDYLELIAGSGTAGQLMALEGHKILVTEDSLVARAARNRAGVMENDVRRTVDFLPNPMLPETKAEIAVPMIVGDKVVGVLDLQSDAVGSFTEQDLRIFAILASQIAVAHENAKQYALQVETAQKLREVDLLKSEFLASMSHELRTPLNSIIGFADVLLEGLDGELNDRMEEDVRLIRQSGSHLRELIGDILDMSKIEAGKMDLRYELINISRMAQDIMKTAHPLAQEKSLELLLDLDETVGELPADRTRLRQILWNIMGNAIKFTEKGSVTLRIASKADHLLISVKDTGIGISESHIPIVFEQFRQVDGSMERVAGGAGLGMPITKRLVELHGGDIWVESVVDQGSTFFFTLPYEPPVETE